MGIWNSMKKYFTIGLRDFTDQYSRIYVVRGKSMSPTINPEANIGTFFQRKNQKMCCAVKKGEFCCFDYVCFWLQVTLFCWISLALKTTSFSVAM